MSTPCQLYKFNTETYDLEKHNEEHFLNTFDTFALDSNYTYWLNFHRVSEKDILEKFWDKQSYHRLTFEDVYNEKQRPKLEEFDNYLFFSIQSALPKNGEINDLTMEQISFILGDNYLLSFQERSSDHFTEVRDRLHNSIGKIRERGADFLLFKMLDAIVDNLFETLENINELNRSLENRVLRNSSHHTLNVVEVQKRKLTQLRKIVMPLKEIAMQLEKLETRFLKPENKPYFSDLKDNCLTIIDEIATNKQVLDSMTNLYYAMQGQRMNEIMKVLTIVSSIFIPLTFIVGVYGMNFKYMPELSMPYGYYVVWGVMALVAIALTIFFIRKGWLKNK